MRLRSTATPSTPASRILERPLLRSAYKTLNGKDENRPSTNPRGCVSDLWGFRLLAERDDGGVGSAIMPRRMRRARLCARRSVESDLAARDVQAFSQVPGERRADGGRRKNEPTPRWKDPRRRRAMTGPPQGSSARPANVFSFAAPSAGRVARFDEGETQPSAVARASSDVTETPLEVRIKPLLNSPVGRAIGDDCVRPDPASIDESHVVETMSRMIPSKRSPSGLTPGRMTGRYL
jgi:hypothetical protein